MLHLLSSDSHADLDPAHCWNYIHIHTMCRHYYLAVRLIDPISKSLVEYRQPNSIHRSMYNSILSSYIRSSTLQMNWISTLMKVVTFGILLHFAISLGKWTDWNWMEHKRAASSLKVFMVKQDYNLKLSYFFIKTRNIQCNKHLYCISLNSLYD